VIASALDVAAGLVCVGSTLTRHDTITEDELRARLSRMGTIDLRVDYLRPGRVASPPPVRYCVPGTRLRSRVSSYITKSSSISPAPQQPIWWVKPRKSGKMSLLFSKEFS
jgi:hypothetical protein